MTTTLWFLYGNNGHFSLIILALLMAIPSLYSSISKSAFLGLTVTTIVNFIFIQIFAPYYLHQLVLIPLDSSLLNNLFSPIILLISLVYFGSYYIKVQTKNSNDIYSFQNQIEAFKSQESFLIEAKQHSAFATLTKGIAHEIRNPLALMLSTIELLLDETDNPQLMLEYLPILKKTIIRINKITTTMFRYANPTSEKRQLIEINPLINDVALLVAAEVKKRNIDININLTKEPYMVVGDEYSIGQAILNLLSNAFESIENQGKVAITTKLSTVEDISYICIQITDNGKGVSSHIKQSIFNPFISSKPKQAGLGLSITSRICDEHKGFIEHKQLENKTAFTLFIPTYNE